MLFQRMRKWPIFISLGFAGWYFWILNMFPNPSPSSCAMYLKLSQTKSPIGGVIFIFEVTNNKLFWSLLMTSFVVILVNP